MESSQRSRNAAPSARREHLRTQATEQLPGDAPVDEADAELERADPVGPPALRALLDPGVDLRLDGERVARVACQRMGLREHRQVQVPIRFPEVLDVPDFAFVAVVDGASRGGRRRRAASADRDSTAADRRARSPRDRRSCICRARMRSAAAVRCAGAMRDVRRQETQVACRQIGRWNFMRGELLRQHAQAARQPVRHFGARHHFADAADTIRVAACITA